MQAQGPMRAARALLEGPLTRPALMYMKRQQFLSRRGYGAYFGLFEGFEAARAWLPPSREFDDEALAAEYVHLRSKKVFAYDYPVMWWLEQALRGGARNVLDVGGSVGVHYYAYGRYFQIADAVSWRVLELPSMVAIGQALAEENRAEALSFVSELKAENAACDVLLACGSLHYLEDGRPAHLIERLPVRPRHVILNKLPLYGGDDYVTTQNLGEDCYAPMHVYNRARFIAELRALGYELRDQWSVHERSLYLPGHPDRSLGNFSGLYFWQPSAIPTAPGGSCVPLPSRAD